MLDPQGRAEILEQMHRVNREQGKTVLMITHYAEEAAAADRIFVMGEGRLLAAGTPREIFGDETLLTQAGLLPPVPARLYHDLRRLGVMLGRCPLTEEELAEELCRTQAGENGSCPK